MLVEPVYRGYRIEVQAELVDGALAGGDLGETLDRDLNGHD
jgi:hypothetical protein